MRKSPFASRMDESTGPLQYALQLPPQAGAIAIAIMPHGQITIPTTERRTRTKANDRQTRIRRAPHVFGRGDERARRGNGRYVNALARSLAIVMSTAMTPSLNASRRLWSLDPRGRRCIRRVASTDLPAIVQTPAVQQRVRSRAGARLCHARVNDLRRDARHRQRRR